MFVHREGVNPNSMDGVPDLRDHRSLIYICNVCIYIICIERSNDFYQKKTNEIPFFLLLDHIDLETKLF